MRHFPCSWGVFFCGLKGIRGEFVLNFGEFVPNDQELMPNTTKFVPNT